MASKNHNLLGAEKSPYLLQHKDNPIWWQPWGEAALQRARDLDLPVFLSIGYSTCHWCHVMEGDSFIKDDVAALLNENFVAIKVDREERPDVDSIYMHAVQTLTGHGGWPLSVFLTPEGQPFWGGTFIPRPQFKRLLEQISGMWRSAERARIFTSSTELSSHLRLLAHGPTKDSAAISIAPLQKFYRELQGSFDHELGGFGGAPKFPSAMAIMTLFRIYRRAQQPEALNMALKTLQAMARGGIHDHLGGGFHRYATDAAWLVPHFEKMLYDNALLSLAYLEAFQITKDAEYAGVARSTLDYVRRELQDKDGGFYAAEDADSEKTEGKFYVWHYDELEALLTPAELAAVVAAYGVSRDGNFSSEPRVAALEQAAGLGEIHHANILCVDKDAGFPQIASEPLASARRRLLAQRQQRIRPLLDTKIISSWNGLMIAAMAKGGAVLGDPVYTQAAARAADFILGHLWRDGRLLRRSCDGEARFAAGLEDYAGVIFGLLELAQVDFSPRWLEAAVALQDSQDELFSDPASAIYFDDDGRDQTLFMRTRDVGDNAMPSGNSLTALNLLKLAALTLDLDKRRRAEKMLTELMSFLERAPRAFPQLLQALDYFTDKSKEIAVLAGASGEDFAAAVKAITGDEFIPNKVVVGVTKSGAGASKLAVGKTTKDDKTTIYVCENFACALPSNDLSEALNLAKTCAPLPLS